MADTSFYGGRSGFSFIIVRTFSSVAEMVANFKKGPDYSAVHYNEHVLINTENKNNSDNGKIFRRGYDYTDEMGGAIYIGTIVGPAGRAPMLELTTIEQVKLKHQMEGFENRYNEGSYSTPIDMVPGKDGNQFNDTIEWASCCVRNENNEDSVAYIGFRFPYLVEEFSAKSVSPYYHRNNNTDNFVNEDLVSRIDDKTHPFYGKWHFNVPKGIKGDAFKNFRIMTADTSIQDYAGRQDDINNNRKVLVYDYYHYDRNENGEPVSIYLGDYNMITGITIDENGTITVDYSHNDSLVYEKLFQWIKKIFLGEDNKFHIIYNTGKEEIINDIIKFIDRVYLDNNKEDSDYKFHIVYNTGEDTTIGDPINYIIEMAINKINYHLLVYYSSEKARQELIDTNNAVSYNNKDGWLDLGSIKDDAGVLIGFNISSSEHSELEIVDNALQYLNNTYPNGLTNPLYYGKIVTIGKKDENKLFYAFDYNINKWYYLGAFNEEQPWTMITNEDDITLETQKQKLAIGGVWFMVEGEDD